mgnify:CR=1 FL=1
MNEGWATDDSCVVIGESQDDEDSLVICLIDEHGSMMSAILERSEIEGLVDYMAEWIGYPLILNSSKIGGYDDWSNE